MREARRYVLIRAKGKFHLLSQASFSIIEFLGQHGGEAYYADLADGCELSHDILYVMCQRLEAAKIIERRRDRRHRIMTVVKLVAKYRKLSLNVLR